MRGKRRTHVHSESIVLDVVGGTSGKNCVYGRAAKPVRARLPLGEVHVDRLLVRRFEREIASLRRLDHPGIVGFLEHGVHLGRPYYVMDHIDGIDLRLYSEKLAQRPPKERYARCRLIGRSLSETLAYLHSQGLVHRDVKPSNVLVAHDQRIVLTDFGVVKDLADSEQTQVGLMVGTPAFAAPEQVEGTEVDHRADLFGLGGTLYYVLTCKVPFASRDRRVRARPAAPSDTDPAVPPDLEAVVLRLMAPDAQHRFPDAAAVGRALATDTNEGVPVAGRKQALEAVATALEDAQPLGVAPVERVLARKAQVNHLVVKGDGERQRQARARLAPFARHPRARFAAHAECHHRRQALERRRRGWLLTHDLL